MWVFFFLSLEKKKYNNNKKSTVQGLTYHSDLKPVQTLMLWVLAMLKGRLSSGVLALWSSLGAAALKISIAHD